jgi:long-subunit acyl-CoA synthetase (AMP-forming)
VLPSGEIGELHVRGCSLFSGYVRNSDANRTAFTADGWLRTGDSPAWMSKATFCCAGGPRS